MPATKKLAEYSSRCPFSLVAFCALLMLPLGCATAPHDDDYAAVEQRLTEAVQAGEVSLQEAAAMMDALQFHREEDWDDHDEWDEEDIFDELGEWIEDVGEELEEAIESGEMTEEEAWKEWYRFKDEELAPKLKDMVREDMLSEEEAMEIWHEIEMEELRERLGAAVEAGEITEEEARAKYEAVKRKEDGHAGLSDHYKRLGIDEEAMGSMKEALADSDVHGEQMDIAFGCILRLVRTFKSDAPESGMDAIRTYMKEDAEFTDEQVKLVFDMARRVSMTMDDPARRRVK